MNDLKDKIWLTAHARMVSEQRYRQYDLASHLFLSYMSLLMIVSVIYSNELQGRIPHFEKISLIISLLIFSTSLIMYGFKFSETASSYRECYLKLQSMLNSFDSYSDAGSKYDEILSACRNHASADFEALVIERTLFKKCGLSSGGKEIRWDILMLLKYITRRLAFSATCIGIPLATTLFLVRPFF